MSSTFSKMGELARLRIGDVNLDTGEIRVAPSLQM
jgi:hypothetical protein